MGGDVEALHFFPFKNDGFAMLGLVVSCVIVANRGGGEEARFGEVRKLKRSVTTINEQIGRTVGLIKKALVLLDGAEEKDDGVMHQGQSLTSLPRAKDRTFVDLVLGLGKNVDNVVAPVGMGAIGVGHDDTLGFARKLSVFIKVNAFCKGFWIERDGGGWRATISSTQGFEEEGAE